VDRHSAGAVTQFTKRTISNQRKKVHTPQFCHQHIDFIDFLSSMSYAAPLTEWSTQMVAKAPTILRKRGAYWTPSTILVTSALDPSALTLILFLF
jgi:hypothetical protein